jgi:FkbM family methyltransferase
MECLLWITCGRGFDSPHLHQFIYGKGDFFYVLFVFQFSTPLRDNYPIMESFQKKIIYDFGANDGLNISYYLKKADRVIAVEANPVLCEQIRKKFHSEISAGKLIVENYVITDLPTEQTVPFHIHKSIPVLSCFPTPPSDKLGDYTKIMLPSIPVLRLIKLHGSPFYIKLDIEHMDEIILKALLAEGIRPPFISAESHSIDVFILLAGIGGYRSFNLVDGLTVSRKYEKCTIETMGRKVPFSFPDHSAGPFGLDIQDPWMTPDNFFRYLALEGLGWKDVHATTEVEPDSSASPLFRNYVKRALRNRVRNFLFGT